MFAFGLVTLSSVVRLLGDHTSTKAMWGDVAFTVIGVLGIVLSATRLPAEAKVPQQEFNEDGELE